MAERSARTALLIAILALAALSVVLSPSPSRADEDITGEWAFAFEGTPMASFCIGSVIQEGSLTRLLMSCEHDGLVEVAGALGVDGNLHLVGVGRVQCWN